MKNKLKVAVLFGGQSSEHDVSCMSVKNVLRNLDPDKYEPVIIGITKEGSWKLVAGCFRPVRFMYPRR